MKRILVVDDDPVYLRLMANKLRMQQYEVYEASNGREAINLSGQQIFDLIISDVSLPDLSGISLKSKLQEQQQAAKVILISAYPIHEMVIEDTKLEIDLNFFLKPVDFDRLLNTVLASLH